MITLNHIRKQFGSRVLLEGLLPSDWSEGSSWSHRPQWFGEDNPF